MNGPNFPVTMPDMFEEQQKANERLTRVETQLGVTNQRLGEIDKKLAGIEFGISVSNKLLARAVAVLEAWKEGAEWDGSWPGRKK